MARLFTNGFENGGALDWTSTSGSPAIQSGFVRSGAKAGLITSLASGVAQSWTYQFATADVSTDTYFRFYFNVAAYPNATSLILCLKNAAANDSCDLRLTSAGSLGVFDNTGGQVGVGTTLSLSTWYRIEVRYFNTSIICELKVDGVVIATESGTGSTSTIRDLNLGGNLQGSTATSGTWYFDDIAINNTTGTTNNSYPSEIPANLTRPFNNSGLRPHPFSPGLAR